MNTDVTPCPILIATNLFVVGGRETYIQTWLRALEAESFLIASRVTSGVAGLDEFREVVACGQESIEATLKSWLDKGGDLIRRHPPALIWGQHFDLFPAWLLAQLEGVPLFTTFHGPLIGGDRPNDLMQALGMTLAIHRGEGVSGVSEEVLEDLRTLSPSCQPDLIPNVVKLPESASPRAVAPPRKFVLLTRRGKLQHIREAALLFARYSQTLPACKLIVADGEMNLNPKDVGTIRAALRQLGARWCTGRGLRFLLTLRKIHFIGWTADPRAEIRRADAVMGMGRVILEAIAEGKTPILVGYESAHGVVTPLRFDELRRTNFSGRGALPQAHDEIVEELKTPPPLLSANLRNVDVEAWLPRVRSRLEEIARQRSRADNALAQDLLDTIMEGGGAADVFSKAVAALTESERRTLYMLTAG